MTLLRVILNRSDATNKTFYPINETHAHLKHDFGTNVNQRPVECFNNYRFQLNLSEKHWEKTRVQEDYFEI